MTSTKHVAANLAASEPTLVEHIPDPLVAQTEQTVGIAGVRLFFHDYGARSPAAPFQSSRFTIEPDCSTVDDSHAVHEVWFVCRGAVNVFYAGTWRTVGAGQAVRFQPWQVHRAVNPGSDAAEIVSVWWRA
jgi:quercetin dioxygenase-like cupin family protein